MSPPLCKAVLLSFLFPLECCCCLSFSFWWCCPPSPPLSVAAFSISSVEWCCLVSSFFARCCLVVSFYGWCCCSPSPVRWCCLPSPPGSGAFPLSFCVVLLGFLLPFGWCCCFSFSCLVVLLSFSSLRCGCVLHLSCWVLLGIFFLWVEPPPSPSHHTTPHHPPTTPPPPSVSLKQRCFCVACTMKT